MSPDDLESSNTRRNAFLKTHTVPGVKQLSVFYYQNNLASKFIGFEPFRFLRLEEYSRSVKGTVQNRRYLRTQGTAANDSLTYGTIDRTAKSF